WPFTICWRCRQIMRSASRVAFTIVRQKLSAVWNSAPRQHPVRKKSGISRHSQPGRYLDLEIQFDPHCARAFILTTTREDEKLSPRRWLGVSPQRIEKPNHDRPPVSISTLEFRIESYTDLCARLQARLLIARRERIMKNREGRLLARLSCLPSSVDLNRSSDEHVDSPRKANYIAIGTDNWGSPVLFWLVCFSLITVLVSSATDVVTYHNDIARTGQNLQETILTTSNVNSSSFGKLFALPVEGIIDAQPLYLSAVSIPGKGTHNVVYAVTENDRVYAFDADTGLLLWHVSVLGSGESPSDDHGCFQISPQIGVTSTPVIDRSSGPH